MNKDIIKKPTNKKVKLLKMLFAGLGATISVQLTAAVILGARNVKEKPHKKLDFEKLLKSVRKLDSSIVSLYKDDPTITEINIPENIKEIDENTFSGFKYVKKITISKSTGIVKQNAFSKMDSLEEIHIKDKSHIIGTHDLNNKVKIRFGEKLFSKLEWKNLWNKSNLNLDDNILSLSYDAFKGLDKIKEINTNKVSSISSNAFSGLNLEKLHLGDEINNIVNNNLFQNLTINKLFIGKALMLKSLTNQYKNTKINDVILKDSLTSVPNEAFSNMLTLKNVTLSENIKTIGDYAFANTSLENIDLKNVEELKDYSFANTKLANINLKNVKKLGSSIFKGLNFGEMTLSDSIENVVSDALAGLVIRKLKIGKALNLFANQLRNTNLSEVEFLNSISKIPKNAFEGVSTLNKVTLSDSINEIDDYAFSKTNISGIDLKNVTKLGEYVFDSLYFKELILKDTLTSYSSNSFRGLRVNKLTIGKFLEKLNSNTLEQMTIREVNLLESIDHIPNSIFNGVKTLENVTFSDSIKTIGDYAFSNTLIKKLDIKNVNVINKNAFKNAYLFEDFKSWDKIETIDDNAFENTRIAKFVAPKTLKKLGKEVFKNCDMFEMELLNEIQDVSSESFKDLSVSHLTLGKIVDGNDSQYNIFNGKSLVKDFRRIKDLTIKKSVSKIQNSSLSKGEFNNVVLEDGIEEIDDLSFAESGIKKITIPNSLKKMSLTSFENIPKIREVTIGDSLRDCENVRGLFVDTAGTISKVSKLNLTLNRNEIEDGFFTKSKNFNENYPTYFDVDEIELSSNITKIGNNAIWGLRTKQMNFQNLTSLGKGNFKWYKLKDVKLGKGLTTLVSEVFANCEINKISMEGVKEIQSKAFYEAKINYEITNTNNVETIGESAFEDCSCSNVKFDNATFVGKRAFYANRELLIASFKKLKKIEDGTFAYCHQLKYAYFHSDLNYVGKLGLHFADITNFDYEKLEYIGERAFESCRSLESITLQNVTKIGEGSFSGCEKLTNIGNGNKLNDNLTDIPDESFSQCHNLILNGDLPSKLESIGKRTLAQMRFINDTVTFNNTKILTIKKYAFSGNPTLKYINFNNKEINIEESCFSWCDELLTFEGRLNVKKVGYQAFSRSPKLKQYQQSDFPNCTDWNDPYAP